MDIVICKEECELLMVVGVGVCAKDSKHKRRMEGRKETECARGVPAQMCPVPRINRYLHYHAETRLRASHSEHNRSVLLRPF